MQKLQRFLFEGTEQDVAFVKTDDQVAPGVVCDDYSFSGDPTRDLAIIRIAAGKATPRQRVLKGTRTVEGYVKGSGWLLITRAYGYTESYAVGFASGELKFQKDVCVGDIMKWEAAVGSDLIVYEVCYPPYTDDRYENLT